MYFKDREVELATVHKDKPNKVFINENPVSSRSSSIRPLSVVEPFHVHGVPVEEESLHSYQTSLWFNRLLLCSLCIAMVWMTSLQISTLLVNNFIPKPSSSEVIDTCQYAWTTTQRLRSDYADCVSRQSIVTFSELTAADKAEAGRIAGITASNAAYQAKYHSRVGNYSAYQDDVKKVFSLWLTGGGGYSIPYFPSCTGEALKRVSDYLDDSSDSDNAVMATSNTFSSISVNRVARMASYADALTAYNAEYVANKTASLQLQAYDIALNLTNLPTLDASINNYLRVFDLADSCLTLNTQPKMACIYGKSFQTVYSELYVSSQGAVNGVESWIDDTIAKLNRFVKEVAAAVIAANSFYDGVMGMVQWIVMSARLVGSSNYLCGRASPDWCGFTKANWMTFAPNVMDRYPKPLVPVSSAMWARMNNVYAGVRTDLAAAGVTLRNDLQVWAQGLQNRIHQIDFTPDDYNPPVYNTTEEQEAQESDSQSFLQAQQTNVYQANTTKQTVAATVTTVANNTAVSTKANFLSYVHSSWASFHYANIDVGVLLASFLSVQGVLYIFDYIYRVVQTLRLVTTFWGRGVVVLPKLDLRRRHDPTDVQAPWFTYTKLFLQILPYIWIQLAVVAACFVLMVWFVVAVLVPEYNGYVSTCVRHETNSTLLSSNLYAASYNYAYAAGNSDMSAQLSKYNAHVEDICSSQTLASKQTYVSFLQDMTGVNDTLAIGVSDWQRLTQCVDMQRMNCVVKSSCQAGYTDSLCAAQKCPISLQRQYSTWLTNNSFIPATYTQDGYDLRLAYAISPATAPNTTATVVLSNMALRSAKVGIYDCAVLPTFHVKCAGPSMATIDSITMSCSCMIEWFWNSYLAQTTLALLVFITLNTSRTLIGKGLVRVFWRSLSPAMFECMSDCDDQGTTFHVLEDSRLVDEDTEQGCLGMSLCGQKVSKLPIDLRDIIQKKLREYERRGYIMLVIGCLINILWMVLLGQVNGSMQYTPQR